MQTPCISRQSLLSLWQLLMCVIPVAYSVPVEGEITQDLLMRGAKPLTPDAYLCTGYPLQEEETYIYKFEAVANASTAHHMLVYGCDGEAFSNKDIWNCPQMCKGAQTILFAWAKNAKPTVLPKDVGFRVGKSSNVKTIVLQVHYARKFVVSEPKDHSGIKIYKTFDKPKFVAGIFLLMSTWFRIPPHRDSYPVDMSCIYQKKNSMFPFAYRTHAHGLGKVITGYQYNDTYHMIGKGNPQWPQAFYPVEDIIEVKPGDSLAARCTYDSTSMTESVSVGATGNDEMCNFYIMFYTDSSDLYPGANCLNNQIPTLTGSNFPADVSVPLPPNPALEHKAGGHAHHAGMPGSKHQEEVAPAKIVATVPTIVPTEPNLPVEASSADDIQKITFSHPLELNSSWSGQTQKVGQVGGLAVGAKGRVYVFHRGARVWNAQSFNLDNEFQFPDSPIAEDTLLIMEASGQVVRAFGARQYYMPHGITVDTHDNIWITDVALHQVFKIPAGATEATLTVGQRLRPGSGLDFFCKPTDTAVLSTGEFFVADGYCNSRIIKFSADGRVIRSWGEQLTQFGIAPPPNTFAIPHSLALGEKDQLLCVADRENGRIQCFDLEGNLDKVITHREFGPRLFAVEFCPLQGGILFAVNGPSFSGPADLNVEGFTMDFKTGDLLEIWNVPQGLRNPHDVAVDPSSMSVYVGELNPQAVWKLSRVSMPTVPPHMHSDHNDVIQGDSVPVADTNVLPDVHTPVGEGDNIVDPKVHLLHADGPASLVDPASPFSVHDPNLTSLNDTGPAVEESSSRASIIIGVLLVVPVVTLLVITLVVRANQAGKLKCFNGRNSRVINLQKFLGNSHRGFDKLSTEDDDHDVDESDDNEEYSASVMRNGKA